MNKFNARNKNNLRVIRTGRTEKIINEAADAGFWPLVKKVEPSPLIRSKYAVLQDPATGEIRQTGDYRDDFPTIKPKLIDWTHYYPYSFPAPFAAYLLPADLQPGERVFLEDVIEDIVSSMWNQGSASRLKFAEAIWNGKDFEIQFDPEKDLQVVIG